MTFPLPQKRRPSILGGQHWYNTIRGNNMLHSGRLSGRILLVAAGLVLTCVRMAGAAEPDIAWAPKPFTFEPGASVRYIDFENGDDANSGTQAHPWRHHPWDKNAAGTAAACKGIHTYCFKRGAAYRGSLVATESGAPGEPIRLTVDPSWGTGRAVLCGSRLVKGPWLRCDAQSAPDVPAAGRTKTWYVDLDKTSAPRLLWEVRDGKITRIPIARTPNWRIVNHDDPRSEWWEFTGRVLEVNITLESAKGFKVGERITGTGRWEDFDENRDNIAKGRNRIVAVTKDAIKIEAREWKKGEIKRGGVITNGKVRTKIIGMDGTHTLYSRMVDSKNLTHKAPSYYTGAVMWSETDIMPRPIAMHVLGYDPAERSLRILSRRNYSGPTQYNRYFLEGLPQFLDSAGEFCFVEQGERSGLPATAGRLYLRLPGDRDPNHAVIEAAHDCILIKIRNQSHIEISGLDIRFGNTIKCGSTEARHAPQHTNAVYIVGNCARVTVRNCRIHDVPYGVISIIEKKGDMLDSLAVTDNDMWDLDGAAIALSNGRGHYALTSLGGRMIHARVMRNRLQRIGRRKLHLWGLGGHAIDMSGGEVVEVAGNVIDDTWGAGIRVFNGGDFSHGDISRPLIRVLIHHNKATNTLRGIQDYGGIASWMGGPSYVYNNISGNPVGYKHHNYRRLERKDWYRTSCYGVGIYIDGQYKGYVFNNIMWGKNNNVNDRIYNSCGFNEAMGFMNVVFNNTIYNFGVGLHKGMTQHNRCYYLGNLMLDIGHKFIQQEPQPHVVEHHSLAWAKNVYSGEPQNFGQLGHDVYPALKDWQKAMNERRALAPEAGILAPGDQVRDAATHDFNLRRGSAAIDRGARVFVPWALYAVVGEWGFYRHPADPAVILGENINMNEEWFARSMFQDIPRNDLKGHGIDDGNYKIGALENWTRGALELNGGDEFCVLAHADLVKDYTWADTRSKKTGTFAGKNRVTVDMDANNFLIEIVFKTRAGQSTGGLVCKCARQGYILEMADNGMAKMDLQFGGSACSRTSAAVVNDGKWHHLIAEVNRKNPQGINLYLDGRLSNGPWSGRMDKTTSLSNPADFLVGKTGVGAAGDSERFFAGALDFLRVSRGTLADAETTIEELYQWEVDGPFLKDFHGRSPTGRSRDAGAVEYVK